MSKGAKRQVVCVCVCDGDVTDDDGFVVDGELFLPAHSQKNVVTVRTYHRTGTD